MKLVESLALLRDAVAAARLSPSAFEWTGAGVAIRKPASPVPTSDGFRPAPRLVVTEHALELSWLFEELGRAFFAEGRIDGNSKGEFFGRLANAANHLLGPSSASSARDLCEAALLEAYTMAVEMDRGTFRTLAIAQEGRIAADDSSEGTPQ